MKKVVAPIVKKCPVCTIEFQTDKRHNRKTCSVACQEKYIRYDHVKNNRIKNSIEGVKRKYGVSSVWKIKSVVDKSKKTKLEKYGTETYVNPEKGRHTKFKRYGNLKFTLKLS